MLAAPILALGLPTLVVLNMADDLRSRGGEVDVEALPRQLGAPVALISAAQGEGLEPVYRFLAGSRESPPAPARTAGSRRTFRTAGEWAARIGQPGGLPGPRSAGVDPPAGCASFSTRSGGPLIFAAVVLAVFQTIFTGARPLMDARANPWSSRSGAWARFACCRIPCCARCWSKGCGAASARCWFSCRRSCCCSCSSGSWKTPATWPAPR